jgi:hypothetical protein
VFEAALFTLIPPVRSRGYSRCSSGSHHALDLEGHEFVLAWRQTKPPDVVDGTISIEQQNDDILTVEKLLEQFVRLPRVATERLSEGHTHTSDPAVLTRRRASCAHERRNASS